MGSEVIFLIAPLGPIIILILFVKCFNEKSRPYALPAILGSFAVALIIPKRPTAIYWDFFLLLTLAALFFGIIAKLAKMRIDAEAIENANDT